MKPLIITALIALPVTLALVPAEPFQDRQDLAEMMPESTLGYIEGPGLSALLDAGLEHPFLNRLLSSDIGLGLQANAGQTLQEGLDDLESKFGQPILPALAKLTREGIALGIGVKRGKQTFALIARGDAAAWEEYLRTTLKLVAEANELPEDSVVEPHGNIRDVDVWYLGDDLTLGLKDGTFLASNDEGVLRDILDLGAGPREKVSGLASHAGFAKCRSESRPQNLLWSWIDLEEVSSLPGGGLEELRQMQSNVGMHFLLGPVFASLGAAQQAAIGVALGDDSLTLAVNGHGIPEGALRKVLMPEEGDGVRLPIMPKGIGAQGLLYRDLQELFHSRTELFPVDVLPSFASATSNLALFFGGMDVAEDIFPMLSPWIGVVIDEPRFGAGLEPELPLPGAVLITTMTDPELMGPRLTSAFQTAVGVINADSAQKMQPAMMLELSLHEGIQVTSARFPRPREGEGIDMRHNLVPACSVVGEHFIIGTHASLVKDIVAKIKRGEMRAATELSESLALSGQVVARTLRANLEALTMQAVLEEGKSMEQARSDIEGLMSLADLVKQLRFETRRSGPASLQMAIQLQLQPKDD